GNQRLDIRSVSCDHPAIAAEIVTDPKKDPENIGYVRIQVRDGADLSQDFTTDVVAQTNIPGAAEVHIPVAFYVAAP
ncbi:MAG TPA: hypothetical protein P5572_20160, partial [Phycisphaerae bacterium]|nr:hypothetical protein [Phycisphaerae bacterium]